MSVAPDHKPTGVERGIRFGVIVIGVGAWLWTQYLLGARLWQVDSRTVDAAARALTTGDRVLEWTAAWNEYLHANPIAAVALLAVSSALIDVVAVWMFLVTIFGRTIRPFLGLIIVFVLRQLALWVSPLPAPMGMLWEDPGVPTLLVTYAVTNDFFFSGHTAIVVLGGIELTRRYGRAGLICGCSLVIFEVMAVLVLRAHYTMDVFTGAVVAILAAIAAARLTSPFDGWIARLASGRLLRKVNGNGVEHR